MRNTFRVMIHYRGNTRSDINVVASDDVKARNKAIRVDEKSFKMDLEQQPEIEYCEIELIASDVHIA